jgi:hypothetical protein
MNIKILNIACLALPYVLFYLGMVIVLYFSIWIHPILFTIICISGIEYIDFTRNQILKQIK